MKAAIALLADYRVQNFARRIVFELDQHDAIEPFASRLPAHISLKQPFSFESMATLESYFDALAARIAPFPVELNEIYYAEWDGYGILGLNVRETATLRRLHEQLNRELAGLFTDTSAPHDGDAYHFHMTIELGKVETANPYQTYFENLADTRVNLAFRAEALALFYYSGADAERRSFFNYKVLPLSGRAIAEIL